MPLPKKVLNMPAPKAHPRPVWQGPEVDGITYSLLSRFLCCRERFRLLVVEGLRAQETFYAPIEYGQMWHTCEQCHAAGGDYRQPLTEHGIALCKRYPTQQEQISHWFNLCQAQFPYYVEYWAKHPEIMSRRPLLQEQVFDVPYALPSGRVIRLRGKWDSVDLVGFGGGAVKGKASPQKGIWLQENKTKSRLDEVQIRRQLTFDLQTMIYVVALQRGAEDEEPFKDVFNAPFKGVRYNVVRRSQHKSVKSFVEKLEEDKACGKLGEWFARWNVEVTAEDIKVFRRQCLDPILEHLCDWWALMQLSRNPFDVPANLRIGTAGALHWRHPFGVWNVLDEGGSSDLDHYLLTGSDVGLQRVDNLFPEL